jgi:glycerol dehydrogenase-like iron-containing ADH family enzyme
MSEQFLINKGHHLAENFFSRFPHALALTERAIWKQVRNQFVAQPQEIYFVESLEQDFLDTVAQRFKDVSVVVGIGGGKVADIAKYLHWKNGSILYQIPTIISVDAFFTHEIAVRRKGAVTYVGDAVPTEIIIDYEIIQTAPILYNRYGIGDILSCYTGLFDWKYAADRGYHPPWNETLQQETVLHLTQINEHLDHIHAMDAYGIDLLVDTLNWIGWQCFEQHHPRFEEGSEHYVVYNLEYRTGKQFPHGQAVCLGTLIMAYVQHNSWETVQQTIKTIEIPITPESLQVSWQDLEETLVTLKDFVWEKQLAYSLAHEYSFNADILREIRSLIQ